MTSKPAAFLLCSLLGLASLTGCATVVSGRDATVAITSTPPQAQVAVRNQEGKIVATGVTPMKVPLDRSRGLLKKPPHYTATIQKPGFETQQISINPKLNPWLAGNVVLGGPIGVIADSATGAMWNPKPNKIDQTLTPAQGNYYSQNESVPENGVEQVNFAHGMSNH